MSVDATIALCSLAEVKEALRITASSEDTVLENLINRASAFANRYTNRQLVEKSYTEFYDGDNTDELILKNFPIVSFTSLYDDTLLNFGSDTLIATADYIKEMETGIIRLRNNKFTVGRGNIKAVYSAGYGATVIPYDLRDATIHMVQYQYKRIYQDQLIGLASETIGDRTITYTDEAFPKKSREILDRYRNVDTTNRTYA